MKIRNGFVSNSSSSSFVIAKSYMTKEQGELFENFIGNSGKLCSDTYISSGEYYFLGTVEQCDNSAVVDFLVSIGVDEKYIEFVS